MCKWNEKRALLHKFTIQVSFTQKFSVGKLFFTCGAGDDASYVCFEEIKNNYFNRSFWHGTEMRHRNLRSDSVLVHTGYIGLIGTEFRYPTLSLSLLSTNKLVCGEHSGTIWLPSHHPGGCCTLVVDEEIPPLLCKVLECWEKRYIKFNKLLLLCFHVLYATFWLYHLNVTAEIETHQTRQRFSNLLLPNFGEPMWIVASVSCS